MNLESVTKTTKRKSTFKPIIKTVGLVFLI